MNTEARDFKTEFKEYLFNTANHKEKNIEEWYLKQTIKFIEDFENKQKKGDDKPVVDTESCNIPFVSNRRELLITVLKDYPKKREQCIGLTEERYIDKYYSNL